MAFNKEENTEPFWSEYSKQSGARDPLAVQNSNVVIYSKLIVGITNVTNRIRYNGFYCWIINEFLHDERKRNSRVEQIKFIRRSELLLAYMMANEFPNETGVSGISYARKNLQDAIDLSAGADWENKISGKGNLYWNTNGGAFVQYYAGVMRYLNLIFHPKGEINVYTLTEKGKELAESFSTSVKSKTDFFLQTIRKGSIQKYQLSDLKIFSISQIDVETKEYDDYKSIILDRDDNKLEPSFNRRDSIQLVLNHVNINETGNSFLSFLQSNYQQNISKELEDNASTYWYIYELNELSHYSLEHVHSGFLHQLTEYPQLLSKFTDDLMLDVEENIQSLFENHKLKNTTDLIRVIELTMPDIYQLQSKMVKSFSSGKSNFEKSIESISKAVILFLKTYIDSKNQHDNIVQLLSLPKNNLLRKGNAIELYQQIIIPSINLKINEFLKKLLLFIVNTHIYSSYKKSTIGQNLGHNYMIDGDYVWKLRVTEPTRTSPRLQNLYKYILDLNWIQKNGDQFSVSELGTKILSDL